MDDHHCERDPEDRPFAWVIPVYEGTVSVAPEFFFVAVDQWLQAVCFMHFARVFFGGGDNLTFTVNAAMNVILKVGFAFAPAPLGSVWVGCVHMLFVDCTGFGGIIVIVY